jgi:hypothetical protein
MRAYISVGGLLPGVLVVEPENETEAALLHHWIRWGRMQDQKLGVGGETWSAGPGGTQLQAVNFSWAPPPAVPAPADAGPPAPDLIEIGRGILHGTQGKE